MNSSIELDEIKLVGISCRTNNRSEMNPDTAKIGTTVQKYFSDQIPSKILKSIHPGITYCVYTDYESDLTGDFTFFIGEVVDTFDNISDTLDITIIPPQSYVKFTTEPGAMPEVCINMWQKIWALKPDELGGNRNYIADFEVYDERAIDRSNTVLDLYIGVKK